MMERSLYILGCSFLFISLLVPLSVMAQDANASLYNKANAFYKSGDYESAIKVYNELVSAGVVNSNLYYNLANAYLRANRNGEAILWYERALALSPRDKDIKANLEFARKRLKGELPKVPETRFNRTLRGLRDFFTVSEWGMILSGFFWVIVIGVLGLLWVRRGFRAFFIYIVVVGVIGLVLSASFLGAKVSFEAISRAVVIEEKVLVRSGPGEDFAVLLEISSGNEVILKECRSGYCEIDTQGGISGWVQGSSIEKI